ncbi:PQQ-dependent sugar dehydrogenase [Chryseosolibacter indicus]|uniref:PQQ-dependent sugar dehydrogenase n=1 Tax=Chryseosolibacter indicus TaxID=2782351 RepID=A0ABS5VPW9_9BACT|nr:PQQ-dependent sugar dehydrogenase [Chryseosolibacter indicus]MBT1702905.1 PQQ-dependent sugar dehydrogenase [Chryseosolibacter indicus]
MKLIFCCPILILLFITKLQAQPVTGEQGENFTRRVVKSDLSDPWEITYGPDNFLWVTEAKGYRVSRINPEDGSKSILIDLNTERNFPRYDTIGDDKDKGKAWPQGGLMGLALHPSLLNGKPFVYLTYIYRFAGVDQDSTGCSDNFTGCFYTARLVRYEYDQKNQKLHRPVVLCDTIPQSNDHNSGRLAIGMHDGKPYLFYTVGDMGAGQHENAGRQNYAQTVTKYEGKVLRFNLEPDNDKNIAERWIPNDNPFNTKTQNAVWSIGHRNAQGIAYAEIGGKGRIFSSEHGPFGDDEINIIERGMNYGHPLIIGYNDNNYNGYAAGVTEHSTLPAPWHSTYPIIENENNNAIKIGASYRDPIKVLHVVSPDSLKSIFERTVANDPKKPDWPAEAPSSIAVYTSSAIPGWQNSLLIPTLKTGKLIRLKLNERGDGVIDNKISYFPLNARYRDIAISADGKKIYVATDNSKVTSGPSAKHSKENTFKGCIIEYSYEGNISDTSRK